VTLTTNDSSANVLAFYEVKGAEWRRHSRNDEHAFARECRASRHDLGHRGGGVTNNTLTVSSLTGIVGKMIETSTNWTRYAMTGVILLTMACKGQENESPNGTTADAQGAGSPDPAKVETDGVGGSNFVTYQLENCNREPFGVIANFGNAADAIRSQLQRMFDAGQRRLRIPIFHHRGSDSGTVMDSSGGRLSDQNRDNLVHLLAAVKQAGFLEVEVGFFPTDGNNPANWSRFDDDLYQENWNFIHGLHPILAQAGLPYRIDLSNEGMPMSTDPPARADYARRLWNDYTANFGKSDTVGFSMTVWIADRISQIPNVYGSNPPDVLDLHIYGDDWNGDEYKQLVDAHHKLQEMGYAQSIIVGETYFNDGTAADNLRRAVQDTGRKVLYVTEWPLSRSKKCADVDVAPPVAFDEFSKRGF